MGKVVKTTFSLAKLARKLDADVAMGLNMMIKRLNVEIQRNTEAGIDVKGKSFKTLSNSTQKQRDNKWGYYKKAGGGGTLNWSGNMKKTKVNLSKPGPMPTASIVMTGKVKKGKSKGKHYGVYHNEGGKNLPKRKWFGMTKSMEPGGKIHTEAMTMILTKIGRSWKKR